MQQKVVRVRLPVHEKGATLLAMRIGTMNRKRQQAGRTPNASRSSGILSLARQRLECVELAPAFWVRFMERSAMSEEVWKLEKPLNLFSERGKPSRNKSVAAFDHTECSFEDHRG